MTALLAALLGLPAGLLLHALATATIVGPGAIRDHLPGGLPDHLPGHHGDRPPGRPPARLPRARPACLPRARPACLPRARPARLPTGARRAAAATTGLLSALVVVAARDPVDVALGLLLVAVLVPVVLVDLTERRIPNAVTGPAAAAAIVLGTALDPGGQAGRLAAGAGATAFLLVPALVRPAGMGMGDVKLAGVLGLCLGPPVAVALLGALLAGTLAGAAVAVRSGLGRARRATLAFGPCLALGAVGALAAGPPLLHGYVALL